MNRDDVAARSRESVFTVLCLGSRHRRSRSWLTPEDTMLEATFGGFRQDGGPKRELESVRIYGRGTP
jgi:hypothetical protein